MIGLGVHAAGALQAVARPAPGIGAGVAIGGRSVHADRRAISALRPLRRTRT